jgi:hypothetical protein
VRGGRERVGRGGAAAAERSERARLERGDLLLPLSSACGGGGDTLLNLALLLAGVIELVARPARPSGIREGVAERGRHTPPGSRLVKMRIKCCDRGARPVYAGRDLGADLLGKRSLALELRAQILDLRVHPEDLLILGLE